MQEGFHEGATEGAEASGERPRARRAGSRCLAGVLALAALGVGACQSGKVASANLDSLHDSGGRYHYRARLLSPTRAFFGSFVYGVGLDADSLILKQKEKEVRNPARKTLENLLDLAGDREASAPPSLRAHRVRQYAYLACNDPSALVRERALIELGFVAAAAGLGAPEPPPEQAANAAELSEAIAGLAEVVRPLVGSRGPFSETERADLAAACEVLEDMQFDVEGAHRLLAVTAAVLDHRDADGVFAPVAELSARVERGMIREALTRSLGDEVPRTRAAAFEANWRAYGDPFLREALRALVGAPPAEGAIFQLRPVWAGDEEIFISVFQIVREAGLPQGTRSERLEQLYGMTSVAVQYTLFSDRTRNAAMLALSDVSDSGIRSLRLEDWQRWWDDYGEREREALRAAEEEAAATPPVP